MSQYVFRVLRNGEEYARDAVELGTVEEARADAGKLLFDVAGDDVQTQGWKLADYQVDVCNRDGLLLFSHALTTFTTTALASR